MSSSACDLSSHFNEGLNCGSHRAVEFPSEINREFRSGRGAVSTRAKASIKEFHATGTLGFINAV